MRINPKHATAISNVKFDNLSPSNCAIKLFERQIACYNYFESEPIALRMSLAIIQRNCLAIMLGW